MKTEKEKNNDFTQGIEVGRREGKSEAFCKECGFPIDWERNPVIIESNIFSLAEVQENTCKTCGHQKDGYTIKKIEHLLRRFKEAGKSEAIEDKKLVPIEKVLEIIEAMDLDGYEYQALKELKSKLGELSKSSIKPEDAQKVGLTNSCAPIQDKSEDLK